MKDWKLKYRPTKYEDVIGQQEAVAKLQGEPSNAYIIYGVTGSGKTTLSRIFAKEHGSELIELDASSMGKDEVKALKNTAYYKPMLAKSRVILIDECHALSSAAWQTLLKVIEETPSFTTWILVTTEISMVPDTIQNRARKVKVGRVSNREMYDHLVHILSNEGHNVPNEVLLPIVTFADGSVRAAIEEVQTYIETGILELPSTRLETLTVLAKVFEGKQEDLSYISDYARDMDQDDIHGLIATISDAMIYYSMAPGKTKEESRAILYAHTGFTVNDLPYLKKLLDNITRKLEVPGNTPIEQAVGELYKLFKEVVSVYTNFGDNRYSVKAVLVNRHMESSLQ